MGLEVKLTCDKCRCEIGYSRYIGDAEEMLDDLKYETKRQVFGKYLCSNCMADYKHFREGQEAKQRQTLKDFINEQSRPTI